MTMMCELCGKRITEGVKIRLEGVVVTACTGCRGLGEVVEEVKPQKPRKKPAPVKVKKQEFNVDVEYELIDGFGDKIKAAREKLGWTQEDLGKKVNETHSLIHRMESGRYEPSVEVARKLERKLDVRLLAPSEEAEAPTAAGEVKDVTLGDMVVVRKRVR